MSDTVLSELKDGIRTITLNRPDKLNAMNREMVAALAETFHDANADGGTRVIIFRGGGRAFCAGDDLTEHEDNPTATSLRTGVDNIQAVTREIVLGNKIVVGAIHGWAVGGGLEWAVNCDLPLWAESARGFFPELQWGRFVTGGVTSTLPHIVGLTRTKELILLGERHTAQEFHEMGLAWRVVLDDKLFEEAEAVAAKIAELPTLAVTDFKRVINRACYMDVEGAMALETEAAIRGAIDPASLERIRKFSS